MKLVYTGSKKPVTIGDVIQTFRGDWVAVISIREPHDPNSTGRVGLRFLSEGYDDLLYPSEIHAEWTGRVDQ